MLSSKIEIAPSIFSADFRCIEKEVKAVEDAGADRIHCDVMDGHFVPNLTFGPILIEAVKKCTDLPLDVHLMISNPDKYIDDYCNAGAGILIVHAETCENLGETLGKIRSKGVRAAVTVNPDKPIELFLDYLDLVDQVLIMSVFAGFSGQKFITETMEKVRIISQRAAAKPQKIDIEVDGGINDKTAEIALTSGANVLVAGSYVFGSTNHKERIEKLRGAAYRKKG